MRGHREESDAEKEEKKKGRGAECSDDIMFHHTSTVLFYGTAVNLPPHTHALSGISDAIVFIYKSFIGILWRRTPNLSVCYPSR